MSMVVLLEMEWDVMHNKAAACPFGITVIVTVNQYSSCKTFISKLAKVCSKWFVMPSGLETLVLIKVLVNHEYSLIEIFESLQLFLKLLVSRFQHLSDSMFTTLRYVGFCRL